MKIEEIDRYCDLFEERLKAGENVSVERFLEENQIPSQAQLLSHLKRVRREYLASETRQFPESSTPAFDPFDSDTRRAQPAKPKADRPTLPSRYQSVEEIGRGGMGAVWRVTDAQFDRSLAVKVMMSSLAVDEGAVARFQREAILTGSLQHPGIPPVVDRGKLADGSPFFSMKLVEGQTLAELLADRGSADAPAADFPHLLGIVEQVCQAVGYAHSTEIIHRDLKPANIMVGTFGEVQVMDWGMAKRVGDSDARTVPHANTSQKQQLDLGSLAKTVSVSASSSWDEALTHDGTVMGTLAYMPPEQARGDVESVDSRADVFALGAILCEVLTGERPYVGDNVWQQAVHADHSRAFARLDKSDADTELIDLCKRCLAAEPAERPHDGSEVAAEIRRYQESVQERLQKERSDRAAAEARALEEQKRVRAERSKRRTTLALAIAVLLLVVGGGATAWWYQQEKIAEEVAAVIRAEQAGKDIESSLEQAAELRDKYRFDAAATLIAQAESRMSSVPDAAELVSHVQQAQTDLETFQTLEAIRLSKSTTDNQGDMNLKLANGRNGGYAKALRDYGIELDAGDVAMAVARIRRSAIKEALLAALDDWAKDESDDELRDQILAVARASDGDPQRRKLRDLTLPLDELIEMSHLAERAPWAPATLVSLAWRLDTAGESARAIGLLIRAGRNHPQDFWVQYTLANLLRLRTGRREEAIGYYRAAISTRPRVASAHNNLGVLLLQNHPQEAEVHIRLAIEMDPHVHGMWPNLGEALRRQGKLEAAAEACHEAIRLSENSQAGWVNLGLVLAEQDKLGQAEAAFHQALEINSQLLAAWDNLGVALRKQKKLEEAVDAHNQALAIDPDYAPAWTNLGNALADQQQLDAAAEAHKKAIELNGQHSGAWNNLGLTLHAAGKLEEALDACRESVDLDPDNGKAWCAIGRILYDQEQSNEALSAYQKGTELEPMFVPGWTGLGDVLQKRQDLPGAAVAYKRALEIDRKCEIAWTNLGVVFCAQRKFDEAIKAHEEALRIKPKFAIARNNLGEVYRELGQLDKAIAEYKSAIKCQWEFALAWSNLGVALGSKGDPSSAVNALEQAVELDPELAVAWHNLGIAHGMLKQWKEAEAAQRRATELAPLVAEHHRDLGVSLAQQKKLGDAEKAFREAITLKLDDSIAHYSLGNCLRDQGKLAEAAESYREAIRLKYDYADAHFNLAALLYRRKVLADAEESCRHAIEFNREDPSGYGMLSSILIERGKLAEAIIAAEKARDLLPLLSPQRIGAERQLQLCKKLMALEQRLPDVLEGQETVSVPDLLQLAERCRRIGNRYLDAVKLYKMAFAEAPSSFLYMQQLSRTNAACAAVLGAAGKDGRARQLNQAEKAELRKQALEWIREDLAAFKRIHQVQGGIHVVAQKLREDLQHWRASADLARVREEGQLSKLPKEEQEEWRSFWSEVELLADAVGSSN